MPDTSDLFEIMQTTRAMRRLKPDPVPDAVIRKIIQAGVCAPNGGNTQRWRFLVVKDAQIKRKVQVWYKRAFDEVIGPRYLKSAPPPGVTREAYVRQHAAVEYLTNHFHEAPVWIVACIEEAAAPTRWLGASIYPAVQNMLPAARALGLGATPPVREGDRGRAGLAARRALVRHPSDRLPHGPLRSRRPRPAEGRRVRERVGTPVSRRRGLRGPPWTSGSSSSCSATSSGPSRPSTTPTSSRCWPPKRSAITPSGSPSTTSTTTASARRPRRSDRDRKSTRLNSSHQIISYAVFCLKKKNH